MEEKYRVTFSTEDMVRLRFGVGPFCVTIVLYRPVKHVLLLKIIIFSIILTLLCLHCIIYMLNVHGFISDSEVG